MKLLANLQNIQVKYVVIFMSVVIFYFFAFEKRYFQINSDWKILCDQNNYESCGYVIKSVQTENHSSRFMAVYSKITKQLHFLDIYKSALTGADILSPPVMSTAYKSSSTFEVFDTHNSSNGLFFCAIDNSGNFVKFIDWKKVIEVDIISSARMSNKNLSFHSIDCILKENIAIVTGQIHSTKSGNSVAFIICLNETSGNLLWNTTLDGAHEHHEHHTESRKQSNIVYTHWKLQLMERHLSLDHLRQKTSHISLKGVLPISFTGKNVFYLTVARKSNKVIEFAKLSKQENYNSALLIHQNGIALFDIHKGVILASEDITFDLHSTYTRWPIFSNFDDTEAVFEVKFLSKLDHHSNDNFDKIPDEKGIESRNNKIHCSLIFNKITKSQTLSMDSSNFHVGHLCDPVNYLDYPRFDDNSWLEDPTKTVAPIITDDYATPSGFWGRFYHILGRKILDLNSKNSICISSDGLMTSYSSHGHLNWRTNAQVGWLHIGRLIGTPLIDTNTRVSYKNHFVPSITEVSLSYFNKTLRGILSVGFESLSFVDLSDGHLLATHSLPCTPTDKPLLVSTPPTGFLSTYGDQIVIITCENMVIGFSLTHYIPWTYFITLSMALLSVLLFLIWALDPHNKYIGELWISN